MSLLLTWDRDWHYNNIFPTTGHSWRLLIRVGYSTNILITPSQHTGCQCHIIMTGWFILSSLIKPTTPSSFSVDPGMVITISSVGELTISTNLRGWSPPSLHLGWWEYLEDCSPHLCRVVIPIGHLLFLPGCLS